MSHSAALPPAPAFQLFADGIDVTSRINDRLLSLNVKDAAGHESDTLSFEVDDRDGLVALPREKAKLGCWLGYAESGLVYMGLFAVDDVSSKGGSQGQRCPCWRVPSIRCQC